MVMIFEHACKLKLKNITFSILRIKFLITMSLTDYTHEEKQNLTEINNTTYYYKDIAIQNGQRPKRLRDII